jgi:hypothetical protein
MPYAQVHPRNLPIRDHNVTLFAASQRHFIPINPPLAAFQRSFCHN